MGKIIKYEGRRGVRPPYKQKQKNLSYTGKNKTKKEINKDLPANSNKTKPQRASPVCRYLILRHCPTPCELRGNLSISLHEATSRLHVLHPVSLSICPRQVCVLTDKHQPATDGVDT